MSKNPENRSIGLPNSLPLQNLPAGTSALVVPVALGGALYLLSAALIDSQVFDSPLASRYLVGHPISRITSCLFCIGLVNLIMIWRNDRWQARHLSAIELAESESTPAAVTSPLTEPEWEDSRVIADRQLKQLASMPETLRSHLLFSRLAAVLSFLHRGGSAGAVESEMKHLADVEAERQHQGFAFVRILIWATPMLGFLGTVIGISHALGQLNVGADNDLQSMMSGLQSSLYVAFDTTAQALVLSMFLMFGMFFVERNQAGLLQRIDSAAIEVLGDQFAAASHEEQQDRGDAYEAVRRLGRKMLATTRAAVQENSRIWRKTIESAEHSWVTASSEIARQNQQEINDALVASFAELASQLDSTIHRADACMAKRWEQWQTMLSDNTRHLEKLQGHNHRQLELLTDALEKMGAVAEKQNSLQLEASLIEIVSAIRLLKEELQETQKAKAHDNRMAEGYQLKVSGTTRQSA